MEIADFSLFDLNFVFANISFNLFWIFFNFLIFIDLTLTTDAGPYIVGLLDNYGFETGAFLYGILEMARFT